MPEIKAHIDSVHFVSQHLYCAKRIYIQEKFKFKVLWKRNIGVIGYSLCI